MFIFTIPFWLNTIMLHVVRLLSKDPLIAKEAANLLRDHLVTLRPGQATPYEQHLINDERLMREISLIADDPTPACIWRKRGRTAYLFRFLAVRFLGAPDSVGGCESIHAQWQWLECNRRNLKLPLMNALLSLRNYIRTFGELPSLDSLNDHLDALESFNASLYRALLEGGEVAPRMLRQVHFRERFNLTAGAADALVQDELDDEGDADSVDAKGVDIAWSNYVRFLFAPHNVYCVTALARNTYFYVAENKSVAYRDAPKVGEMMGRPISLVWLELNPDKDPQEELGWDVFSPCSGEEGELHISDVNLSEISLTSGYYPPDVLPSHTDRDVEIMHERRFLDLNVERMESRRVSARVGASWDFLVKTDSGIDLEHWAYETRDLGSHTKMSLARQLQARDNLTDDERDRAWTTLSRRGLLAAMRHPLPLVAPAPALGDGGGGGGRGGGGGKGVAEVVVVVERGVAEVGEAKVRKVEGVAEEKVRVEEVAKEKKAREVVAEEKAREVVAKDLQKAGGAERVNF